MGDRPCGSVGSYIRLIDDCWWDDVVWCRTANSAVSVGLFLSLVVDHLQSFVSYWLSGSGETMGLHCCMSCCWWWSLGLVTSIIVRRRRRRSRRHRVHFRFPGYFSHSSFISLSLDILSPSCIALVSPLANDYFWELYLYIYVSFLPTFLIEFFLHLFFYSWLDTSICCPPSPFSLLHRARCHTYHILSSLLSRVSLFVTIPTFNAIDVAVTTSLNHGRQRPQSTFKPQDINLYHAPITYMQSHSSFLLSWYEPTSKQIKSCGGSFYIKKKLTRPLLWNQWTPTTNRPTDCVWCDAMPPLSPDTSPFLVRVVLVFLLLTFCFSSFLFSICVLFLLAYFLNNSLFEGILTLFPPLFVRSVASEWVIEWDWVTKLLLHLWYSGLCVLGGIWFIVFVPFWSWLSIILAARQACRGSSRQPFSVGLALSSCPWTFARWKLGSWVSSELYLGVDWLIWTFSVAHRAEIQMASKFATRIIIICFSSFVLEEGRRSSRSTLRYFNWIFIKFGSKIMRLFRLVFRWYLVLMVPVMEDIHACTYTIPCAGGGPWWWVP